MTAEGRVVVVEVVVELVLVELVLVSATAVVVVVVSAWTNVGAETPKMNTTRVVAMMVRRIISTLLTKCPHRMALVRRY